MKDPVCGMPVDPSTPFRASHDGTDYYFCSGLCREAFLARPAETLRRQLPTAAAENRPGRRVAYLTMEIALDPRMATYSGGLGVLARHAVDEAGEVQRQRGHVHAAVPAEHIQHPARHHPAEHALCQIP